MTRLPNSDQLILELRKIDESRGRRKARYFERRSVWRKTTRDGCATLCWRERATPRLLN